MRHFLELYFPALKVAVPKPDATKPLPPDGLPEELRAVLDVCALLEEQLPDGPLRQKSAELRLSYSPDYTPFVDVTMPEDFLGELEMAELVHGQSRWSPIRPIPPRRLDL